jgi:quercetin dioxygenase-like cupin family protein
MNISKIFMIGQVLGFFLGIGTADAQFARQTLLMPWSTPKSMATASKLRGEAWVMARAEAGGGPAEETPAQAKAKVTYFESSKVSDVFSKGGVLFDGNGGALNYKIHAGRRVAPGRPETHLKDTDVIYVLQGAATFVTGGTSLDTKSTAPDELLGSSIQGGDPWRLKKGDVVIVPKGVPHWFKEVQGTVLYLVVKVR